MAELTLRKSEAYADRWYIERVTPNGQEWKAVGSWAPLLAIPRLTDADVQGTAAELLGLATAIERRESAAYAYHCAVVFEGGSAVVWAPGSTHKRKATVSLEAVDALAAEIRATVVEAAREPSPPPGVRLFEPLDVETV